MSSAQGILDTLKARVPAAAAETAKWRSGSFDPAKALREGDQLLQPRCLTNRPFLSGMTAAQACASTEAATSFVFDMKPVRGQALQAVGSAFARRRQLRAAAPNPKERQHNPLPALQSAPGGGKSAMLDTLVLMSSKGLWGEDHCADADMCNALNGSIPVAITYNSGSDVDLSGCDADVETGLALRILHSFFVDPHALSFGAFCEALRHCGPVKARTAVRACLAATKGQTTRQGVLLLLDEVVNLLVVKPEAGLVALLGSLLDEFASEELNLVCTTLDSFMLRDGLASSGGSIMWAPLPAMSQSAAEALILKALRRADPEATPLTPAARIVISDAAGHPRSLQFVLQALLALDNDGRSQLMTVRDAVLAHFKPSPYDAPTFDAVKLALAGRAVPLNSTPLRRGKDLRALIADGVFINSDVPDVEGAAVVPKLSMLRLLQFSRMFSESAPDPRWQAAALCIAAMAYEDVSGILDYYRVTSTDSHFERFVTLWLQLVAILRGGEVVSASDLFHVNSPALRRREAAAVTPTIMLGGVKEGSLQATMQATFTDSLADRALFLLALHVGLPTTGRQPCGVVSPFALLPRRPHFK